MDFHAIRPGCPPELLMRVVDRRLVIAPPAAPGGTDQSSGQNQISQQPKKQLRAHSRKPYGPG
jgi:hypothetical protein